MLTLGLDLPDSCSLLAQLRHIEPTPALDILRSFAFCDAEVREDVVGQAGPQVGVDEVPGVELDLGDLR